LPAAVAVALLTDGPGRTRSWTIGRSASPGSSLSSGAAIAMPATPSPTMDRPRDDTSSSEQRRPWGRGLPPSTPGAAGCPTS